MASTAARSSSRRFKRQIHRRRATSPTRIRSGCTPCWPGSPDALASSLVLVLEGSAALSAAQPADQVAKHARAASRAIIGSHKP